MKVYAIVEPITLDYHLTLIKPEPPKSFHVFECDMQDYQDMMEIQLQRDQLSTKLHNKIYKRIYGELSRGKIKDLSKMRETRIEDGCTDMFKV